MNSARCIGCGCDPDNHACQPYGCSWLRVNYDAGVGVCSECRALVAEWDQGRRESRRVTAQEKRVVVQKGEESEVSGGEDL
jgi:hypothetical protein